MNTMKTIAMVGALLVAGVVYSAEAAAAKCEGCGSDKQGVKTEAADKDKCDMAKGRGNGKGMMHGGKGMGQGMGPGGMGNGHRGGKAEKPASAQSCQGKGHMGEGSKGE